MSSQIKNIIIVIVVLVLAFGAYSYFKKGTSETSGSLQINAQRDVDILGQDMVRVLNRINEIDLDRSIFTDPVYVNLKDRSQEIQPQPIGKENIFSPYQRSSSASTAGTSTVAN